MRSTTVFIKNYIGLASHFLQQIFDCSPHKVVLVLAFCKDECLLPHIQTLNGREFAVSTTLEYMFALVYEFL